MRRAAILVLALVSAVGLMGEGPCEPRDLDDPIEPIKKYLDRMVTKGETGVPINGVIQYYVGKALDPSTVNAGTVTLTGPGGALTGTVDMGDFVECQIDPLGCPTMVAFTPGGGAPCDLDPNTTYTLTLSGILLANGNPLPDRSITFTTGGIPAGYAPSFCSAVSFTNFVVSGNTLNENDGLSGAVANPSYINSISNPHLEIAAVGVEDAGTYPGYKFIGNPKYIAKLIIVSPMQSFNAGDPVVLNLDGVPFTVYLPAIANVGGTLEFYIADDGSTYNVTSSPDTAFTGGNLAYGASGTPSTTPLLIEEDVLEPANGIDTSGITAVVQAWTNFKIYAIQSESPYTGWDSTSDADYALAIHSGGVTNYFTHSYPIVSPFMIGRYDYVKYGDLFAPEPTILVTTDSWLLIYIENKGASAFNPGGQLLLDVVDGNSTTVVTLPADQIPAGEALPLYVSSDGSTFYAYDNAGDHTLDLWANGCDGSCPTIDPVTALQAAPAAP